jgi:hypothetical protein
MHDLVEVPLLLPADRDDAHVAPGVAERNPRISHPERIKALKDVRRTDRLS